VMLRGAGSGLTATAETAVSEASEASRARGRMATSREDGWRTSRAQRSARRGPCVYIVGDVQGRRKNEDGPCLSAAPCQGPASQRRRPPPPSTKTSCRPVCCRLRSCLPVRLSAALSSISYFQPRCKLHPLLCDRPTPAHHAHTIPPCVRRLIKGQRYMVPSQIHRLRSSRR